ncbi:YegP family protein [Mycobacterium sp. 236(2023)]|uniref:YegP family protein n=1 Tax=Mycobacterium sp. 236(2023) TaxID=3038163 RepID=UPI0024155D9D|nr:YegP family protein [Mycobacterium sp. 236(2023)]MDG4668624.1 YegP family protein [Mycobacterium sp. 236(2023)]
MASDESRFVIRKSSDEQYYFFLRARNGEILVTSEMYKQKAGAENGIRAVKEVAPDAQIIDVSDS